MLIRHTTEPRVSEVTDRTLYLSRRAMLAASGALALAGPTAALADTFDVKMPPPLPKDPTTSREKITSYNNFYEFGFGKEDPAAYAGRLTTRPWSVVVDGA